MDCLYNLWNIIDEGVIHKSRGAGEYYNRPIYFPHRSASWIGYHIRKLTLFVPRIIIVLQIKVANEGQINWLKSAFESPTETQGFFDF